ncbi:MAG: helix-turn-helix domain-containing protein [Pseudomonadota bacterium]
MKRRTNAGRRLARALGEVLADVRGETPLPVLATVPAKVNVREVRRKTGLTQRAFAARFGVNGRTLQDGEQGRYQPDAMARALLLIIEREPEAVRRALAAGE